MISIRTEKLSKKFKMPDGREVEAVRDARLSIEPGEFFFILGPSGCGKTTLLRLLAGFIEPDEGRIIFDRKDVTSLAAHQRNAAMVFQNYALFPHMNVFENVAYGLKVRKVTASEVGGRVEDALELVRMEDFAESFPAQLSGGQQQRVALARALVIRPKALLLDEPLSNLDAKLREEMRSELSAIHRAAKTTTVYVTHDQKEALSLADRIALMNDGWIEQVGEPDDLYENPKNRFAAEFMGDANLVPGTVTGRDPWGEFDVLTALGVMKGKPGGRDIRLEQRVLVMIRPEWIHLIGPQAGKGISVQARVRSRSYLGEKVELELAAPEFITLKARVDPRSARGVNDGDVVDVVIPDSGVRLIPE